MVGTIFNLAKINIVPYMCTVISLLDSKYYWLHSLAYIEGITGAFSQ